MYREKKVNNFPIARDGIVYFLVLFLIALALSILSWALNFVVILSIILKILSAVLILTGLFIVFFFRNPIRKSKAEANLIISPADGKVLSITEINEPEFIGAKAVKVSIFLSLFNVHINRSPVEGTVAYHSYREGEMLPAFKSHASDLNERNTIGIITNKGFKVLVHQITGFVARRIVWWVKPGTYLTRGERFGLIRFGSCTEVVMPLETKILVKQGDVVRGGVTAIAKINNI